MGIDFGWNESNVLYVTYVHPEKRDVLEVGDIIQQLNGIVATRGVFDMPTPLPSSYELTILRDNQAFSITYHAIEPEPRFFFDIFISFLICSLGIAILFVTKPLQWGFIVGGSYIAWAIAWLGILTTDSTVSWYANALIFPLVAPLLTASAFYYYRPLSQKRKGLLIGILVISTLLASANTWEQFYLFPRGTNVESLLGIRLEYPILLGTALAFLFLIFALVRRFRQLEQSFEKQSIAIILIFAVLGIMPFTILVIVPVILSGVPWINPTICYALMAFIPLGFLCAIWREQSTNLERILTRIVLASSISAISMLFLLTIQRVTKFGDPQTIFNSVTPAIFLGAVIALYPRTPFLRVLDRLIYGPKKVGQTHLQQLTRNLTIQPTWEMVTTIVTNLAVALDLDGLAVYLRQNRYLKLAAATNSTFKDTLPFAIFPSQDTPRFQNDLQVSASSLFDYLNVNDLRGVGYVPIIFSGNNNGILLANYTTLGNIDANTMTILSEVANLLSISIPAIMVQTAIDEQQAAALYARELERRELADKIHDGPLQDLIYVRSLVGHDSRELEQVISDIRQICDELHDPITGFPPETIVTAIAQKYNHRFTDGIRLEVAIIDPEAKHRLLPDEGGAAISHITQESINNILKHANVDSASINLLVRTDAVEVVIKDLGCGFVPHEQPSFSRNGGLGLNNMRRWARQANGTLKIDSNLQEGTIVTTILPF